MFNISKLIALYSSTKINLVEVNYIEY